MAATSRAGGRPRNHRRSLHPRDDRALAATDDTRGGNGDDGTITKERYDEVCAKAEDEIQRAEAELAWLEVRTPASALPDFDTVLAQVGGWAESLRQANTAIQRDVLGQLVERVIPRRVGKARYDVEIVWTELGAALRTVSTELRSQVAA